MPPTPIKRAPVLKIILIVWLVFSTLYVVYNEYNRLRFYVAKASYTQGVQDTVGQLMQEASKCQPIPITSNGQQVSLIALSCLNQPSDTQNSAQQ